MRLPTVKIVNESSESGWCIINKDDFDAETHEEYSEPAQEKPKARAKANKKNSVEIPTVPDPLK